MGGGKKSKALAKIDRKFDEGSAEFKQLLNRLSNILKIGQEGPWKNIGLMGEPFLRSGQTATSSSVAPSGRAKRRSRRKKQAAKAAANPKAIVPYGAIPAAMATSFVTSHSQKTGHFRTGVRREYLCDVYTTADWEIFRSYLVNPGNPLLFPWLSELAKCFSRYKCHKCCLIYQTDSSVDLSGMIQLACEPDVNAEQPRNKQELMAILGAARAPIWSECCMEVPKMAMSVPDNEAKYVFYGTSRPSEALTGGVNDKDYCLGRFVIATEAESGTRGELYVEYDFEFLYPDPSLNDCLCGTYVSAGTVATASPLGSTEGTVKGNLGLKWKDANELYIQATGSFLLRWFFSGTTISSVSIAIDGTDNTATEHREVIGSASAFTEYHLNVNDVDTSEHGATLTFTATVTASTNIGTVVVTQISDACANQL